MLNLTVTIPEDSKGSSATEWLWKIIELASRALSVVIWVQPSDQKELDDSLISGEQTFAAQNHYQNLQEQDSSEKGEGLNGFGTCATSGSSQKCPEENLELSWGIGDFDLQGCINLQSALN